MTSDRKKPGVAFWATVVVVVALVAYPLSFGPACRIAMRNDSLRPQIARAYRPLVLAARDGPKPIQIALTWFAERFAPPAEIELGCTSAGFYSGQIYKLTPIAVLRAELD